MNALISSLEKALLTLWVGGLWVIGYLVAPLLFSTLDDRQLAGALAGQLFQVMGYVGMVAGVVLLVTHLSTGVVWLRNWRAWILIAMLALVLIGTGVVQPMMQELKAMGLESGSAQAARFGLLHGVSSTLYLLTSLGGLLLVVCGSRAGSGVKVTG